MAVPLTSTWLSVSSECCRTAAGSSPSTSMLLQVSCYGLTRAIVLCASAVREWSGSGCRSVLSCVCECSVCAPSQCVNKRGKHVNVVHVLASEPSNSPPNAAFLWRPPSATRKTSSSPKAKRKDKSPRVGKPSFHTLSLSTPQFHSPIFITTFHHCFIQHIYTAYGALVTARNAAIFRSYPPDHSPHR